MRFCDADACTCCPLADQLSTASCRRHKAQFCMWLSTTQQGGSRTALEKLSLELMDEASALEKEGDLAGSH
jgi:hypothetical protein